MNIVQAAEMPIVGFVPESEVGGPREECGVVGVFMSERAAEEEAEAAAVVAAEVGAAETAWRALSKLQHRGYDGAGIYVKGGDGEFIGTKGLGKLPIAVPLQQAIDLDYGARSRIAVGHVRWGTSPSTSLDAAQPFKHDLTTLSHNGHAEGVDDMADLFAIDVSAGVSDSDKLSIAVEEATRRYGSLERALKWLLPHLNGAYCLSVTDGENLFGVRDPWGFHPLTVGELPGGGYMLASESVALDNAGVAADKRRDLEQGEMVRIGPDGIEYSRLDRVEETNECMMEYIYLADENSVVNGVHVGQARYEMGRLLAETSKIEADVVFGVPESGCLSARGFADAAGIEYSEALTRNEGVDRTFILQAGEREQKLWQKFSLDPEAVRGKRVVVADDSVVRGSTMTVLVEMFKAAGATEVHVVSLAPQNKYECYMGLDTGNRKTLIARDDRTDRVIADILGATSITYNTTDIIDRAVNRAAAAGRRKVGRICISCFTGEYPMDVPGKPKKVALGLPGVPRPRELVSAMA